MVNCGLHYASNLGQYLIKCNFKASRSLLDFAIWMRVSQSTALRDIQDLPNYQSNTSAVNSIIRQLRHQHRLRDAFFI